MRLLCSQITSDGFTLSSATGNHLWKAAPGCTGHFLVSAQGSCVAPLTVLSPYEVVGLFFSEKPIADFFF